MAWLVVATLLLAPCASLVRAEEAPANGDDARGGVDSKGGETGRALPRFVSLSSNEINVRTGPGEQYPVTWKFIRKGLPVEILAEYELWRRIRSRDGTTGWVHKTMLSGRRTVLIVGSVRAIVAEPEQGAAIVARAEPGVQARLRRCKDAWCEVEVEGYRGWLTRDAIWGVYPNEAVER